MWFILALLGYFFLAIVFVMDKMILSEKISNTAVYTFYSTIFMFGALLAYPFGVELLLGMDIVIALIAGVSFGFALWTMFIAVSRGEASHMNPFIGGVVTIFTFLLSYFFLAESLGIFAIIGIAILIVATFLLSFEKSLKYNGFHVGFVWAVISGFLFALSHVASKYIYSSYDFVTGFVWTRAAVGVVALFTLFSPAVWKSFRKNKNVNKETQKIRKNTITFVTINKILGIAGVILIQYASSLGQTTPVFAMTGIQYALMFVMIFLLTRYAPKVFQEYFTRKEIIIQSIGIVLVIVGSVFFVL